MLRVAYLLSSLFLIDCTGLAQVRNSYPADVESVLRKAGVNRPELENSIEYFKKSKDPLKIKAVYFLISNMDIHYSESYYWANREGARIEFDELRYPNLDSAVAAFDVLKKRYGPVHPVPQVLQDIRTIKSAFLIDNINRAFEIKGNYYNNHISFDDFCEYVLPYRVSTEPIQMWRYAYTERFKPIIERNRGKNAKELLPYFASDFKQWFANTYGTENRNEPLPRLGSMQLLLRKKGACEDISDLVAFMMRSEGIPTSMDEVTYWATSTGRHFFNTVFDNSMNPTPLYDISTATFTNNKFMREPAKVIRRTFSKQKNTLASKVPVSMIPPGFLRATNYLDVTSNYWETKDITAKLFLQSNKTSIIYISVFNGHKWCPTWWAYRKSDSATFASMCKGAVFLPQYYQNGQLKPAGYPVVSGYRRQETLKPDLIHRHSIVLKEQDKYLIFHASEMCSLYYWNNGWELLGQKIPKDTTTELDFENVPSNALLLLIPENSLGKERPFTVTNDGNRQWW